MKKTWIILAALLGISGCNTTSPSAPSGEAPPANYRNTVIQAVRTEFIDPYSIRDASISQPIYANAVFDGVTPFPRKGWVVCVRANAKNRMGGYSGQSLTVMLFRGDSVELTLSGREFAGQLAQLCGSAVFQPFPEIDAGA